MLCGGSLTYSHTHNNNGHSLYNFSDTTISLLLSVSLCFALSLSPVSLLFTFLVRMHRDLSSLSSSVRTHHIVPRLKLRWRGKRKREKWREHYDSVCCMPNQMPFALTHRSLPCETWKYTLALHTTRELIVVYKIQQYAECVSFALSFGCMRQLLWSIRSFTLSFDFVCFD